MDNFLLAFVLGISASLWSRLEFQGFALGDITGIHGALALRSVGEAGGPEHLSLVTGMI